MRTLERRGPQQAFAEPQSARRVHRADLEGLLRTELGEDAGQPLGDHRLPHARRPREEQMVPAGRGHEGGSAGLRLPQHLSEVWGIRGRGDRRRSRTRGHGLRTHAVRAEDGEHLVQRVEGRHLGARNERCLSVVGARADDRPVTGLDRREHRGQDAADGPQASIQSQLAEEHRLPARADLPLGLQRGGHDREVKPRSPLRHPRRQEVHRDLPGRQRMAGVPDGGPDPLLRLEQRRVRQPEQNESRQRGPDVRLDLHHAAHHTLDGHGEGPALPVHGRTSARYSTVQRWSLRATAAASTTMSRG